MKDINTAISKLINPCKGILYIAAL